LDTSNFSDSCIISLLLQQEYIRGREREYRTPYCRVQTPFAKYRVQTDQNYKHYVAPTVMITHSGAHVTTVPPLQC
jgi:hypothetical protein